MQGNCYFLDYQPMQLFISSFLTAKEVIACTRVCRGMHSIQQTLEEIQITGLRELTEPKLHSLVDLMINKKNGLKIMKVHYQKTWDGGSSFDLTFDHVLGKNCVKMEVRYSFESGTYSSYRFQGAVVTNSSNQIEWKGIISQSDYCCCPHYRCCCCNTALNLQCLDGTYVTSLNNLLGIFDGRIIEDSSNFRKCRAPLKTLISMRPCYYLPPISPRFLKYVLPVVFCVYFLTVNM